MNLVDLIVGIVGITAFVVSTSLWIYASRIDVSDNIDAFIGELQRSAKWNARAALATGIAVACAAWEFIRGMGWL